MFDPTESDLDLHFQSQLHNMDDVCAQNLSKTDVVIRQSWLKLFKKASKSEKYARNCLMLLMHSQLSELGHLDVPFTNLDNQNVCLEKLVCDYKNNKDDGCLDLSTTFTSIDGVCEFKSAQSLSAESNNSDDFDHSTQKSDSEFNIMLSNAVLPTMPDHCDLNKDLHKAIASQICRYTLNALEELKKWSNVDGNNRFLSTAFQYFNFFDPGFQAQFKQLDIKFEHCLQHIIEVECDRHEKNVRMLYDQQYKMQRKELQAKEEQLRCDHLALALEREKLNSRMEQLKQQEDLHWQYETAAQYNHSLLNLKISNALKRLPDNSLKQQQNEQLANQPLNPKEISQNFHGNFSSNQNSDSDKDAIRPKNYENIDENSDKDSTT